MSAIDSALKCFRLTAHWPSCSARRIATTSVRRRNSLLSRAAGVDPTALPRGAEERRADRDDEPPMGVADDEPDISETPGGE
jgi:hypothetical protein